jgi:hypothetical protein
MTGFIVSVFPFRNRVSSPEAFEGLELGEGKPSRPVLRGPGGRKAAWLLGSYAGPDLGSQRTGHIQFGQRPLRRLHRVSAEREGTPEVHGKKDLSKHMLFQSVRLVGAVGIEIASLTSKSFRGNGVAPPPHSNWSLLESCYRPRGHRSRITSAPASESMSGKCA